MCLLKLILKNKIITDDDDIKKSIREDIIDKLKIIYKIDKKKSNKRNKVSLPRGTYLKTLKNIMYRFNCQAGIIKKIIA